MLAADATCKQWNLQQGTSITLLVAEKGLSDLAVGINEREGKMIALASDDKLVYLLKCEINNDKDDTRQRNGRQKGSQQRKSVMQDQFNEFKQVLKLEGHFTMSFV